MNFIKLSKEKISLLLVVSILFTNFSFLSFPNQAGAVAGVGDVVTDPAHTAATVGQSIWTRALEYGQKELYPALKRAAIRILIQEITNDLVDWINSGFQKNPAFLSDPGSLLGNVANQALGDMLFNNPDLNFLCAPFQLQIKLALGFGFNPGLKQRIGCTLTSAISNVQNAKIGASASLNIGAGRTGLGANVGAGGSGDFWDTWLQITTQPQNNLIGAYLIAKSELDTNITGKAGAFLQQLNWGSGALTFNKCTEKIHDKNGNVTVGRSYTGSQSYENAKTETRADGSWVSTSCQVTTPGRIITDKLATAETQNEDMLTLQAALGDGVDAVIGALANQLLTRLRNGVLNQDSNNDELAAVTADQIKAANQAQGQYLSNTSSLYSYGSSFGVSTAGQIPTINASSYNSFFGSNYSQGFASAEELAASNAAQSAALSSDNLAKPRGDAIARLYSLNDSELNYQNTYNTAISILTQARATFASSTVCNSKYTDPNSQLRAQIINANVVSNIDGVANSARDTASIPWNLSAIQGLMDTSNQHIDVLATAQNAVLAVPTDAQNVSGITTAMIPVNSTSFNLDPQTAVVGYIKTWLTSMQSKYTTTQCPINLTSILAITIPAFQPTTPPTIVVEGVGIPTSLANPTPGTTANPNPISGPFISSVTPSTLLITDQITIKGGQLLYASSTNTADRNSILLDGTEILTGLSGATIQGLALKPFTLPASTAYGSHTIAVKNRLGTTNALTINIVGSWVRCAYEGGTCNFTGTHTVRYFNLYDYYEYQWVGPVYVPVAFHPAGSQEVKFNYGGSVYCGNSTAGDPAVGQVKSCDYFTGPPVI